MRYSSIGAGKRYRAALVYAAGHALCVAEDTLDRPACAVELIHAFSLVHDDLPAMDDDDLRRGKPSCHKAFDEATAILAGDALQTLAFAVLSVHWHALTRGATQHAERAGQRLGSVGLPGVSVDLDMTSQDPTLETLALCIDARPSTDEAAVLRVVFALRTIPLQWLLKKLCLLGLAFQVIDDVLDGTGDTVTLGKPAGADQERGQPTFLSILGEAPARQYAEQLKIGNRRIGALESTQPCWGLAQFTVSRSH